MCVFQIHYLRLTTAILHHEKSRKYLLNNVLYPSVSFRSSYTIWSTSSHVVLNKITFDVMRSVVFFYIKTPLRVKEAGLEELILTTWWPTHFDKEVRGAYHGHFQSRYPSFTLHCCRNRTWPEQFLLWRMVVCPSNRGKTSERQPMRPQMNDWGAGLMREAVRDWRRGSKVRLSLHGDTHTRSFVRCIFTVQCVSIL